MRAEILRSRSLQAWSPKITQWNITPGISPSSSQKLPCRQVRKGQLNYSQGRGPESILDTYNSMQVQYPQYGTPELVIFPPQYYLVFEVTLSIVEHMRKGIVPGNWKNLVEDHSDIFTLENSTLDKEWHINEYSIIYLLSKAWQEHSLDTGPQYLTQGSDPQAAPRCMT